MACDASLRRLRTDYIDLYQLHWPDRYVVGLGNNVYEPANSGRTPSRCAKDVAALGAI